MIKIKEIFSELTYSEGEWDVSTTLEEELNKFLEENKNISIADIQYSTTTIDSEVTQSSALVIYEEISDEPEKQTWGY